VNLYYGNNLYLLSDELNKVIFTKSTTNKNILQPEIIVTQSRGMNKWLDVYFANKNGIWANKNYIQLNNFISDFIKIILPNDKLYEGYNEDNLTWLIYGHLLKNKNKYSKLKDYLENKNDLRLWQFAKLMSNTYDQYIIFRPEKILEWENNKYEFKEKWQADLWNALVQDKNLRHKIHIKEKLFKKIDEIVNNKKNKKLTNTQADVLSLIEKKYPRISFFGISYLPDFLREEIEKISEIVEIHFFLLQPSVCKEKIKIKNSLLSFNAMKGIDFIEKLLKDKKDNHNHKKLFNENKSNNPSLLNQLQSDILNNKNTQTAQFKSNNSIIIQSCHSKKREIEVLKDYILNLLENNSNITISDIVILAPNIDDYAPYIDAVFKEKIDVINEDKINSDSNQKSLFYTIADKSKKFESKSYDLFTLLFEIIEGRFEISKILELFGFEEILNKYDLDFVTYEDIKEHILESGIKWGIDSNFKKELHLPAFYENTWEWGIDRILLGYAMPTYIQNDHENNLNLYKFNNTNENTKNTFLPYDELTGSQFEEIGAFIDFYYKLKEIRSHVKNKEYTLSKWADYFKNLSRDFMSFEDEVLSDLNDLFSSLEIIEKEKYFTEKIEFTVVKEFIDNSFQNSFSHDNFLRGGITFAGFLPMRSLPFKVICILGMNESSYPRKDRLPEFNITKHDLGPADRSLRDADRSLRDADRYLFLETLISVKEKLYISYIGQSIKDNTELEPSILIQELIDYLKENYGIMKDDLLIKQKLQPFDQQYFNKNCASYYTYSSQYFNIAKQCLKNPKEREIFCHNIDQVISKAIQKDNQKQNIILSLNELIRFFDNPAKEFLRQNLNLYDVKEDYTIEDNENFEINHLTQYFIKDDLIKSFQNNFKNKINLQQNDIKNKYSAKGCLPYKNTGDIIFEENYNTSKLMFNEIVDKYPTFFNNKSLEKKENFINIIKEKLNTNEIIFEYSNIMVQLKIEPLLFNNLLEDKLILFRPSTLKPKDLITAWIYHLVINYYMDNKIETVFYSINKDEVTSLIFSEKNMHPQAILNDLLRFYINGIQKPLPFISKLSFNYFQNKHKENIFSTIRKNYFNMANANNKYNYDYNDFMMYYSRCFGNDLENIKKEFIDMSIQFTEPIDKFIDKIPEF